MNTITTWAKQHIVAARFLIALLHIYVISNAVYLAPLLAQAGINWSFGQAMVFAAAGFGAIGIIGLHVRRINNRIAKRRLQKCRFLLMGISCTLLLVGYLHKQTLPHYGIATTVLGAFTTTEKKEKPVYEDYADKQNFYKDLKAYYSSLSKKELRKEMRNQLKELKNASTSAGSVALALLIVLLLGIALFFVAGLACGLSCNGQEGLALLVLIGGLTAIVGLAVFAVKVFRKREKKRKAEQEKPATKPAEPNSTL